MNNLIKIQESLFFKNDGEIDLLTGAMAPNRFDQIVKRDIELAERNGISLAIISLKLNLVSLLGSENKDYSLNLSEPLINLSDQSTKQSVASTNLNNDLISTIKSDIESILIRMNFELKSIIRNSDCISRVSQTGFWIFISAATSEGLQILKNRIEELFPKIISIVVIPRNKNQNQMSWYESIDLIHFK